MHERTGPHCRFSPRGQLRCFAAAALPGLLPFVTCDRRPEGGRGPGAGGARQDAAPGAPSAGTTPGLRRRVIVNTHVNRGGGGRHGTARGVPTACDDPALRRTEDWDLLRRALSRLPVRQRTVLVLRYYEDLSEAAIAELMGCLPGTVKSQASRALAALRRCFSASWFPEARPMTTEDRVRTAPGPAVVAARLAGRPGPGPPGRPAPAADRGQRGPAVAAFVTTAEVIPVGCLAACPPAAPTPRRAPCRPQARSRPRRSGGGL